MYRVSAISIRGAHTWQMSLRYLPEANFDLSSGARVTAGAIEADTDLLGPVLIIIRIKWPRHSATYNNIETMIRDKSATLHKDGAYGHMVSRLGRPIAPFQL